MQIETDIRKKILENQSFDIWIKRHYFFHAVCRDCKSLSLLILSFDIIFQYTQHLTTDQQTNCTRSVNGLHRDTHISEQTFGTNIFPKPFFFTTSKLAQRKRKCEIVFTRFPCCFHLSQAMGTFYNVFKNCPRLIHFSFVCLFQFAFCVVFD